MIAQNTLKKEIKEKTKKKLEQQEQTSKLRSKVQAGTFLEFGLKNFSAEDCTGFFCTQANINLVVILIITSIIVLILLGLGIIIAMVVGIVRAARV